MNCRPHWLLGLLLALTTTGVFAHKASDSFIYLDQSTPGAASVRVDVALRDLALILPLDKNGDGQLTGAELRAARPDIIRAVTTGVRLESNTGPCDLKPTQTGLSQHSDGPYSATRYDIVCSGDGAAIALHYNLLFTQDPLHRGLVQWHSAAGESLTVMAPDRQRLDLMTGPPSAFSTFSTFLYEGIAHLIIGLDHVLFLLMLILPATFVRRGEGALNRAGPTVGSRLWQLAGIVTAFTVAHSLTLALSALELVRLPVAWVELVIALSILVAAVNVIWPVLGRKTWKLAFGFGLIHGFGFASVLGDLTSGISWLATALAGFNIGVELGQLGLLVVFFPLLFLLGRHPLYARAAIPALVILASGVSINWALERASQL